MGDSLDDLEYRAALAESYLDDDSDWQPIESCPKNGEPFYVKHMVRWLPYKKGSGMEGKGRFQEHNGYGWQNIDWEPTTWSKD